MPEQPPRSRKRIVTPPLRTLWWSRVPGGIRLEVTHGIRGIVDTTVADLDEARAKFRELKARHKIEEVRERKG